MEDQENSFGTLGKKFHRQESCPKILGKLEVRPKKKEKKKRSSPNFGLEIRKIGPNQESLDGILGKLGNFVWKIRKVYPEDQENQESSLGKLGKKLGRQESSFGKLGKKFTSLGKLTPNIRKVGGET